MIRFETRRKLGEKTTFTSQQGDTKMVVRVDGQDLIFVSRRVTTVFGPLATMECVGLDGNITRINSITQKISDLDMAGYCTTDHLCVTIDGLEAIGMKVI